MKYIRNFRDRYPIVCSVITTVLFLSMLMFSGVILRIPVIKEWCLKETYNAEFAGELIVALFAVAMMAFWGCLYVLKKKKTGFFRGLLIALYPLVLIPVNLIMNISNAINEGYELQSPLHMVLFTLTMLLVGVAEEFVFRGIITEIIVKKYGTDYAGVWFSMLVSAFIFGSMHMINAVSVGEVLPVAVQAVAASAMGLLLSAIYYRTGNIWVNVFIHASIDFAALVSTGFFVAGDIESTIGQYNLLMLAGIWPYIAVTFLLLRPPKVRQMLEPGVKSSYRSIVRTFITIAVILVIFCAVCTAMLPDTVRNFDEYYGNFPGLPELMIF